MSGIRECNSASNYISIFGKLFHIYKLIHIDLKPTKLTASMFLVLITNVNDFLLFFRLDFKRKIIKKLVVY